MKKYLLIAVAIVLALTSCKIIVLNLIGMKVPFRSYSDAKITEFASELNIPENQLYKLDTSISELALKTIDSTIQKRKMERYTGPVQVRYYNASGELVSHLNIADLYPVPIEWERDSNFYTYPPKTLIKTDSLSLSFDVLNTYLKPINGVADFKVDQEFAVVFWSRGFWKESKRLTSLVQNNASENGPKNGLPIFYINTDDLVALGEVKTHFTVESN